LAGSAHLTSLARLSLRYNRLRRSSAGYLRERFPYGLRL
jgi:hypothetical protein